MHSYVRQTTLFTFLTLLPAITTSQNITPSTPSLDQYDLTAVSCSSQGTSAYCIAGGACCADNTCCGVGLRCISDSSTGGYGCEASKPSSNVNAPSSVSLPLFLSLIVPNRPIYICLRIQMFQTNRVDPTTAASLQVSLAATIKMKNGPASSGKLVAPCNFSVLVRE